jgi:hypothetical protein
MILALLAVMLLVAKICDINDGSDDARDAC